MDRAPKLSQPERSQIKALKTIMNFLGHQEEYGTKKSIGRPSKLNDRGKRAIFWTTSNSTNEIRRTGGIDASTTTMWRINLWTILIVKDLQSAISKLWRKIDKSIIKNIVNTMPERIFQVINRSVSCTDY
uniref:Reverse transcriptase n=1 Tax=Heterorhabditis bacteriophora TaxID=37862 RepID=A0A1I7WJB2_HETBA